jgi:hypothetical protein
VHQDELPLDRSVGERGAVSSDTGDAQAGPQFVAEVPGRGTARSVGTTVYWAAVPKGR